MSHFVNGVDLKIAERYRIPAPVIIPDNIAQRFHVAATRQIEEYDFGLERNVIRKIDEWKRAHDQEEHERQTLMRSRDLERMKRREQEQKQLLTQVSYPSTDDLSSSSDLDDDESGTHLTDKDANREKSATVGQLVLPVRPLPTSSFSTILMPTIVPESKNIKLGTKDANCNSLLSRVNHAHNSNNNCNSPANQDNLCYNNGHSTDSKINYSDFESDTYSSPFDRMELKSINDLDILAQVLQETHVAAHQNNGGSNGNDRNGTKTETTATSSEEAIAESTAAKVTMAPQARESNVVQQSIEAQSVPITSGGDYWPQSQPQPQHQQHTLSYNSTFPCDVSGTVAPQTMYYNSYNLQLQQQQQQHPQPYQYPLVNRGPLSLSPPLPVTSYVPPPSHVDNYQNTYYYHPHSMVATTTTATSTAVPTMEVTSLSAARLKSKSVPDIVNELDQEVRASEQKRRIRNNSQSADKDGSSKGGQQQQQQQEEHRQDDVPSSDRHCDKGDRAANNPKQQSEAFKKLPVDSQILAAKISKMGFSIDIVSTVIEQLGNDDKKVGARMDPFNLQRSFARPFSCR